MKTTVLSALGVLALSAIVGCNESGTTTKTRMSTSDNGTATSTLKEKEVVKPKAADDKTMALKEELRKSTKAQLDATDAAIATLQAHEKTATGDAKKDIDKEIKAIVVCEGVETLEQLTLIKKMGVKVIQGYLTGRPMAPEAFAERMLLPPPMLSEIMIPVPYEAQVS